MTLDQMLTGELISKLQWRRASYLEPDDAWLTANSNLACIKDGVIHVIDNRGYTTMNYDANLSLIPQLKARTAFLYNRR